MSIGWVLLRRKRLWTSEQHQALLGWFGFGSASVGLTNTLTCGFRACWMRLSVMRGQAWHSSRIVFSKLRKKVSLTLLKQRNLEILRINRNLIIRLNTIFC